MLQTNNITYPRLLKQISFNDEATTRRNGGTISNDVTFSEGCAIFVAGSSQKISFKRCWTLKSIRFVLKDVTSFYCKLNSSRTIQIVGGTLSATGFSSPSYYVNGSSGTSVSTTGKVTITVKDTSQFLIDDFQVGFDGSTYGTFEADLAQLFNRALTASEVKNFYKNNWNTLPNMEYASNYSPLLGSHRDYYNSLTVGSDVDILDFGKYRVAKFKGNSNSIIQFGNLGTIYSLTFQIYYPGDSANYGIADLANDGANTVSRSGNTLSYWGDDCFINNENKDTLEVGWNTVSIIDTSGITASDFVLGYDGSNYSKDSIMQKMTKKNSAIDIDKHTQLWTNNFKYVA